VLDGQVAVSFCCIDVRPLKAVIADNGYSDPIDASMPGGSPRRSGLCFA
jgi:hypothetical protein